MIRISFDPAQLSDDHLTFFEQWRHRAADATTKTANADEPDPERRASVWRDFKAWVAEHFFASKCAYCEGPIDAQTLGAAEHWRPKRSVVESDRVGTWKSVKDPQTDRRHPGYWWVAFDWENLVPACSLCNEKKGTKFPIAGQRVYERSTAACTAELDEIEKPLLLHPFRGDDPAEHIGFQSDGCAYARRSPCHDDAGAADLRRATETITVCDLNRHGLTRARAKAQRNARNAFMLALQQRILEDDELDIDARMSEWDGPEAPYSRAIADALRGTEVKLRNDLARRHERRDATDDSSCTR
jgi:hypothetical protein